MSKLKVDYLEALQTGVVKDISSLVDNIDTQLTSVPGSSNKRAMQDRLSEVVNVKDFGAKGDGVTNDGAIFQDAFTYAATAGKPIYIPAGSYYMGETALSFSNANFVLKTDGAKATALVWSSAFTGTGITVSIDSDDDVCCVEPLSLYARSTGSGTAFHVIMSGQKVSGTVQSRTPPRVDIRSLHMAGESSPEVDGWLYGLILEDCVHSRLSYDFVGYRSGGTYPDDIVSEAGLWIRGDGAPVETVVSQSWAFWAKDAARVTGTAEGVFFSQCNFIAVSKGVYWNTTVRRPQLNLSDSHISCFTFGVDAAALSQSNIHDNLIYRREGSTVSGAALRLDGNSTQVDFHDNIISVQSSPNGSRFDMARLLGTSHRCLIHNNRAVGVQTGVLLETNTVSNQIGHNKYESIGGSELVNNGSANIYEKSVVDVTKKQEWTRNRTLRQWGSETITSLPNGGVTIAFNTPFANTDYTIIAVSADSTQLVSSLTINPSFKSAGAARFVARDSNGSPIANTALKIDWFAQGSY